MSQGFEGLEYNSQQSKSSTCMTGTESPCTSTKGGSTRGGTGTHRRVRRKSLLLSLSRCCESQMTSCAAALAHALAIAFMQSDDIKSFWFSVSSVLAAASQSRVFTNTPRHSIDIQEVAQTSDHCISHIFVQSLPYSDFVCYGVISAHAQLSESGSRPFSY
jgi:hypothetical protein